MKQIKAGQILTARSSCDSTAVFTLKVINRTKTMADVEYLGNIKRIIIGLDCDGNEWLRPGNYSMAPVFRA